MPGRNRVTPTGEIVAIDQRGLFLGNRGSIHRGHEVVRPWQVRRWITCALTYKGWRAPMWEPGRWTPLFFWDEAVALAAGHRPCALCRRADHVRFLDAWEAATGERPPVDPIDRRLHAERVAGGRGRDRAAKRVHERAWADLPDGTFVLSGEGHPGERRPGEGHPGEGHPGEDPPGEGRPGERAGPALVVGDRLVPWTPALDGYGPPAPRPRRGLARVLTPPSTVAVLAHGYTPVLHPSVI